MKNKYYFTFFLILSTFAYAQEFDLAHYSDISSIPLIASNQKIQTELQALLKNDYQKFQSNFEYYSAPYLLKTDEALYYEGRSASRLNASSAIVFKDGRLIEYVTARVNTALKYNLGLFSECEAYIEKLKKRN